MTCHDAAKRAFIHFTYHCRIGRILPLGLQPLLKHLWHGQRRFRAHRGLHAELPREIKRVPELQTRAVEYLVAILGSHRQWAMSAARSRGSSWIEAGVIIAHCR